MSGSADRIPAGEACRLLGVAQEELALLLEFVHGLGAAVADSVPAEFAPGLLTLFGRSGVRALLARLREERAGERSQAA